MPKTTDASCAYCTDAVVRYREEAGDPCHNCLVRLFKEVRSAERSERQRQEKINRLTRTIFDAANALTAEIEP